MDIPPERNRRRLGPVPIPGLVLAASLAMAGGAAGQERVAPERRAGAAGRIEGVVTAREGAAALEGARVWVLGTARGATTNEVGAYRIEGVPAGEQVVVVELLGRATERREVTVAAGAATRLDVTLVERALPLDALVVSTTREARDRATTPATVDVVGGAAIRRTRASHPSEIMGQIPGVWVNVTGGEGHMTAIRQPLTTDPVYLYLEDGVPTRSTGFFNHNALYEINLPQADRIEVVKGPATALYGSDAIGGTVNVETRPAVAAPGLDATVEAGADGYARLLASYGWVTGASGIRADANYTRTDGWRDGTAYDRQSLTVRWDRGLGHGASLKTVAAFSRVDQQTAGSSRLPEAAYQGTPELNTTPISYRDVLAARVSTEWERRTGAWLLTATPFARYNAMEILPNWSLSYDPAIWETSNASVGMLAKGRRDFDVLDARVIAGVDVDWSPGRHFERRITPTNDSGVWVRYTAGHPIYDYDVTFSGLSPYLHAEASPHPRVRVTAGLRLDRLRYDYENRLGPLQTGLARRPASTAVSFTRLSPKLGATLDLGGGASGFASYAEGFRAPSEGQLFRQGPAENTVALEPVEAVSWEAGVRGVIGSSARWELAAYRMTKTDDILTYQRPDDTRETQNAGETRHEGIEAGFGVEIAAGLVLEAAWSYARHTYQAWRPAEGVDYAGHQMESAPRTMGTTTLRWSPGPHRPSVAAEWVHLGRYYLDAANTETYPGHDLLHLRGDWPVAGDVTLFASLSNVTDERYAESGGWSAFRGREFAPGQPRTVQVGVEVLAWRDR